jgi:hypothetical protein
LSIASDRTEAVCARRSESRKSGFLVNDALGTSTTIPQTRPTQRPHPILGQLTHPFLNEKKTLLFPPKSQLTRGEQGARLIDTARPHWM